MMSRVSGSRFTATSCLALAAGIAAASASAQEIVPLHDGWQIQSQAKAAEGGAAISKLDYKTDGWTPASVPSTVVAALVAAAVYPEPYFGMDLRTLPGMTYPVAQNFSHFPMSLKSPFA